MYVFPTKHAFGSTLPHTISSKPWIFKYLQNIKHLLLQYGVASHIATPPLPCKAPQIPILVATDLLPNMQHQQLLLSSSFNFNSADANPTVFLMKTKFSDSQLL